MAKTLEISEEEFKEHAKKVPDNLLLKKLTKTLEAIRNSHQFAGRQALIFKRDDDAVFLGRRDKELYDHYTKGYGAQDGSFYVIPEDIVLALPSF